MSESQVSRTFYTPTSDDVVAFQPARELSTPTGAASVHDDETMRDTARDALRSQWGESFDDRMDQARTLLETLPEDRIAALSHTRFQDGTSILNEPAVLAWLSDPSRTADEVREMLPERLALESQVEGRIAAIEKAAKYQHDERLDHELQLLYKIRQRANVD